MLFRKIQIHGRQLQLDCRANLIREYSSTFQLLDSRFRLCQVHSNVTHLNKQHRLKSSSSWSCLETKQNAANSNEIIFKSRYPDLLKTRPMDLYTFIFPSDKDSLSLEAKTESGLIDGITNVFTPYSALHANVVLLSSSLFTHYHLSPGTIVIFYALNSTELITAILACLRSGLTISPANPSYKAGELAHQIRDSGATFLFCGKEGVASAQEAMGMCGMNEQKIIVLGVEKVNGFETMSGMVLKARQDALFVPKAAFNNEHPAFLCYSSGTTGPSKGVMTTHENIITNCRQTHSIDPYNPQTVLMAALPIYHIYCLQAVVLWGLWQRSTIVVMPRFDLTQTLTALQTHKVTHFHVVPPIVLRLAKDPAVDKYNLVHLKELVSAAAPLGPELSKAATNRLGVLVKQAYGMTEMSPLSHYTPSSHIVPGSVGVLVPDTSARLVDPLTGRDVGVSTKGEILIKGPQVMRGYLNNPTATRNTIDDGGWIHTGDIGMVDEQGYWFVVDRIKEMIKYNGMPVVPAELEALLVTHPSLQDAAVVGVSVDTGQGQLPKAFVVFNKTQPPVTALEVQEWVAERVAPYKRLRGGVVFIEEIPKSAAGKILRRLLS